MMGKLLGQEPLFFGFRLEDHVPANHLLRRVDAVLDFGFVRRLSHHTTAPPDGRRSIPS